ncbi:Ricin, partial [Bienertia sinuspersici]
KKFKKKKKKKKRSEGYHIDIQKRQSQAFAVIDLAKLVPKLLTLSSLYLSPKAKQQFSSHGNRLTSPEIYLIIRPLNPLDVRSL